MKNVFWVFVAFITLLFACAKTEAPLIEENLVPNLPETPYNYKDLQLPQNSFSGNVFDPINFPGDINIGFPEPDRVRPAGNFINITDEGAALGRVLFYDKKLSLNNTIACGSCHHQDKAFADGKRVSPGFEGRITERNSMSIVNPILLNNLFWDSRSKTIVDLSLRPVQNHVEMGMEDLDHLVKKLSETPYYTPLFKSAYGNTQITSSKIADALSQFIGSITSSRSRFDVGFNNGFNNFSELERMGKSIFEGNKAKCASCHAGANFSAPDGPFDPYGGGGEFGTGEDLGGAANIGLDLVYKDNGRSNGKFRIPSLRNIELTAPYMHDGRFKTLEEVVEHYSSGIKPHQHLDPKFMDTKGNVVQLNLTGIEKKALVAFLKTLTDHEMTTNPKYSDPFKK